MTDTSKTWQLTPKEKNTVNCSFDSEVKCPFNFSVNYCNRWDKVSVVAVTKVNTEEEQETLPTDRAATVHWLLWFKWIVMGFHSDQGWVHITVFIPCGEQRTVLVCVCVCVCELIIYSCSISFPCGSWAGCHYCFLSLCMCVCVCVSCSCLMQSLWRLSWIQPHLY